MFGSNDPDKTWVSKVGVEKDQCHWDGTSPSEFVLWTRTRDTNCPPLIMTLSPIPKPSDLKLIPGTKIFLLNASHEYIMRCFISLSQCKSKFEFVKTHAITQEVEHFKTWRNDKYIFSPRHDYRSSMKGDILLCLPTAFPCIHEPLHSIRFHMECCFRKNIILYDESWLLNLNLNFTINRIQLISGHSWLHQTTLSLSCYTILDYLNLSLVIQMTALPTMWVSWRL